MSCSCRMRRVLVDRQWVGTWGVHSLDMEIWGSGSVLGKAWSAFHPDAITSLLVYGRVKFSSPSYVLSELQSFQFIISSTFINHSSPISTTLPPIHPSPFPFPSSTASLLIHSLTSLLLGLLLQDMLGITLQPRPLILNLLPVPRLLLSTSINVPSASWDVLALLACLSLWVGRLPALVGGGHGGFWWWVFRREGRNGCRVEELFEMFFGVCCRYLCGSALFG